MKKAYVGRLISVKYTDRKTPIVGYVVNYNNQWTSMRSNPVDYVIDGNVILRHKNVEGVHLAEKFREKVIKLKASGWQKPDDVPLADLKSILEFLTKKHGLFSFHTKSEKICYVGRLKSIDEKQLVIDFLNTRGKWAGSMKFKQDEIRVIEFDTDYLNSLKLVLGSKPKSRR